MIESEVKVRIKNPEDVKPLIVSFAKYIRKETKTDDYYSLPTAGNKYPTKSFRIRKLGSIHQINFKQRISYKNGVHVKNETEFTASNIVDFLNLIYEFGFRKWLRKEKITYLYEIEKNFHIELNYIKKLGWFLEIEYLSKPKEVEKAQKKVEEILKKLKIKQKDIEKDGYTKMLWNKKMVR